MMSKHLSKFAAAYQAQETENKTVYRHSIFTLNNDATQERRLARRSEHHEHAEIMIGKIRYAGAIINISTTGVLVRLLEISSPMFQDPVIIRLSDGIHVYGKVAWNNGGCFGLAFEHELSTIDVILHFENRGPIVYHGLQSDVRRHQFVTSPFR